MRLEKGGLLWDGMMFYVIVHVRFHDGVLTVDCVCDNANNIYSWQPKSMEAIFDRTTINDWEYGHGTLDKPDREVPYEVMWAAMAGKHDDRFDHWYNPPERMKE